jgi:hypothetical protein
VVGCTPVRAFQEHASSFGHVCSADSTNELCSLHANHLSVPNYVLPPLAINRRGVMLEVNNGRQSARRLIQTRGSSTSSLDVT